MTSAESSLGGPIPQPAPGAPRRNPWLLAKYAALAAAALLAMALLAGRGWLGGPDRAERRSSKVLKCCIGHKPPAE